MTLEILLLLLNWFFPTVMAFKSLLKKLETVGCMDPDQASYSIFEGDVLWQK